MAAIPKLFVWSFIASLSQNLLRVSSEYPSFANEVDNLIYKTTRQSSSCIRLTDHTRQIGCSAGYKGVEGPIWYINSTDDIDSLVADPPYPPYIAVIDGRTQSSQVKLFNDDTVRDMMKSGKVVGIVLNHIVTGGFGDDYGRADSFSPAEPCDNKGFQPSDTCDNDWNKNATNYLRVFGDFKNFPIFLIINENDRNDIVQCWSKYTGNNLTPRLPLCSLELKADMSVYGSTDSCYRRASLPTQYLSASGPGFCDPLGDYSPWGFPFKAPPKNESKEVIIIAAKLDSISLFLPELSFGGGEVSGIVTLLSMAETFGRLTRSGNLTELEKRIFFVLFHGESWDYIGSSRMVYDIKKNAFGLFSMENISHFIDLSHLGIQEKRAADEPTYYAHLHKGNEMFDKFSSIAHNLSVNVEKSSLSRLPPSSMLRFISPTYGGRNDISGMILGDYNKFYNNRYYGSRLDDLTNVIYSVNKSDFNINVTTNHLSSLTSALVRTVLEMAVPVKSSISVNEINANPAVVKDLLECFLQNYSCNTFQSVVNTDLLADITSHNGTVSRYTTTLNQRNPETIATRHLLAYYLGKWNTTTRDQCDQQNISGYNHKYFARGFSFNETSGVGVCVLSDTGEMTSTSPVFDRDGYNVDLTGLYSSWAESRWTSIRVRIYISAGLGHDLGLFFGGVFVAVISIVLSVQLHRYGYKLFEHQHSNVDPAL